MTTFHTLIIRMRNDLAEFFGGYVACDHGVRWRPIMEELCSGPGG